MTTPPADAALTGAQAYRRLLRYTSKFWVFFVIGTVGFLFNGLTEAASAKLIQPSCSTARPTPGAAWACACTMRGTSASRTNSTP